MAVRDPLAELAAEIDAETAAADQKAADAESGESKADEKKADAEPKKPLSERNPAKADDEPEDEEKDEEASDEDEPEGQEAKPEKKSKERLIPVSERNKEAAARRKAEAALELAQAELATLRSKPVDGKEVNKTPEQIRSEAKAEARAELQVETFLSAGYSEHGKKEFDDLCNTLSDMGAPTNLVPVAIAATGTPESAAKAIYQLSQLDPEQIEEILAMPVMRQGAALARLVTARPKRPVAVLDDDSEEDEPALGKKAGKVSKAPAPVKPIKGARTVPEGLGDDVPDEVFTERFFKDLEKPRHPH